jgi:hypothetical protein
MTLFGGYLVKIYAGKSILGVDGVLNTTLTALGIIHSPLAVIIGRAMFRDCASRVASAADTIGIRGILVQAITEQAKAFYLALGFEPSPLDPMTLMVTLSDIRAALGG